MKKIFFRFNKILIKSFKPVSRNKIVVFANEIREVIKMRL